MSSTTTRLGLYKPDGTENVNRTSDLNNNWDNIDGKMGFVPLTSSTHPASAYQGEAIYETDTLKAYVNSSAVASAATYKQLLVEGGNFDSNITLTSSAGQFKSSITTSNATFASQRGNTTDFILSGRSLSASANNMFDVTAGGTIGWGAGSSTTDTNLYRSAADTLTTDDSLTIGTNLTVTGNTTVNGNFTLAGSATGNLNVTGNLVVQGIGQVLAAYRSTDSTPRTNNTMTADDQLVIAGCVANAVYIFEGWVNWSCASAVPDIKFDFTGPTGATMPARNFMAQTTTASTAIGSVDTGVGTTLGGDDVRGTINGQLSGLYNGTLFMSSTAGSFTLNWAQNTTDANGVTLKQGSWIKLTRIG